jgi:hypothetical protein
LIQQRLFKGKNGGLSSKTAQNEDESRKSGGLSSKTAQNEDESKIWRWDVGFCVWMWNLTRRQRVGIFYIADI